MVKRYKWLLVPVLVVLAGFFFFYRMYHRDVRSLRNFSVAYGKFDQAISEYSAHRAAQNFEGAPAADESEHKTEKALTELEAKASARLSSLMRNDAELMKLTLEIAGLSGKELAALKTLRRAPADKSADLPKLAKETADLTDQRKTAYARFSELARLRPLTDVRGRPVEVSGVVDIREQLSPEEFWKRFVPAEKYIRPERPVNPWTEPAIRSYFFGKIPLDAPAESDRYLGLPLRRGLLGLTANKEWPLVVAEDIPHLPILRDHGDFSGTYYPRRMGDWILDAFGPAFLLTGDERYLRRIKDFAEFLLYSQYQADGSNRFVQDFYPGDLKALMASGQARSWRGGYDYLFDWEWLDAYGYRWRLHEPDHHVCSLYVGAMLWAWHFTGDERYRRSAEEFFYNQVPRYGFHTGVWKDRRYYWTEYNPSGPGHPTRDATDNVNALVACAAAILGFEKNDQRLLEFARGLLWYCVREWATDGRWFYDGAENPLNARRAESHDLVVIDQGLIAIGYLLKAGWPVGELAGPFQEAIRWHRENTAFLEKSAFFQGWKAIIGKPRAGQYVTVVEYIQVTSPAVKELALDDPIFADLKAATEVRVSRLVAKEEGWETVPAGIVRFDPGTPGPVTLPLSKGGDDILRLEFEWPVKNPDPAFWPAVLKVQVDERGAMSKECSTVPPGLRVNGENLPAFGAAVHLPDSTSVKRKQSGR